MIELAEIMKDIEADEKRELKLKRQLEILIDSNDTCIHSVKWDERRIIVNMELTSSLLNGFPRFEDSTDILTPIDLLSVVPLTAIIAENRIPQFEMCVLHQSSHLLMILGFSGSSIPEIALGIWRVFTRWQDLGSILFSTIARNHPLEMDWREFLIGESGFCAVRQSVSLTLDERKRALNNVRLACVSLLRSVLDDTAWKDSRVHQLLSFIENLQIQETIPRIEIRSPEFGLSGGIRR